MNPTKQVDHKAEALRWLKASRPPLPPTAPPKFVDDELPPLPPST